MCVLAKTAKAAAQESRDAAPTKREHDRAARDAEARREANLAAVAASLKEEAERKEAGHSQLLLALSRVEHRTAGTHAAAA